MRYNPSTETRKSSNYESLRTTIGELLIQGRQEAARQINSVLVQTYWHIGKYIVEYEQNGKDRATYGSGLINTLSKDLTIAYGKGFSISNLKSIRNLYFTFPKSQTLSDFLSWSHYVEVLKLDDALEQQFYIKQCERVFRSSDIPIIRQSDNLKPPTEEKAQLLKANKEKAKFLKTECRAGSSEALWTFAYSEANRSIG